MLLQPDFDFHIVGRLRSWLLSASLLCNSSVHLLAIALLDLGCASGRASPAEEFCIALRYSYYTCESSIFLCRFLLCGRRARHRSGLSGKERADLRPNHPHLSQGNRCARHVRLLLRLDAHLLRSYVLILLLWLDLYALEGGRAIILILLLSFLRALVRFKTALL